MSSPLDSIHFNESRFRQQVDNALAAVKQILEVTRNPRYAEDEVHTYEDKFRLAEFLTNMAFAAQLNVLERMGLDESKLQKLVGFVQNDQKPVTLRFAADSSCQFLKENTVDIESHRQRTTQVNETSSSLFGGTTTKEYTYQQKVITKVKEFHWQVRIRYRIFCFAGPQPDVEPIVLQSRVASMVLITSGGRMEPIPSKKIHHPVDVPLTWLLQNLRDNRCIFSIERTKPSCHTPRRNDEITRCIHFFQQMAGWSRKCRDHFVRDIERDILGKHRPAIEQPSAKPDDLLSIQAKHVFVPVLPLMEHAPEDTSAEVASASLATIGEGNHGSPLLAITDINRLLNEQCRTLDVESESLGKSFPDARIEKYLISAAEARIMMFCWHLPAIGDYWRNGLDYIESMLRKQLVAAIGKEVEPKDFDQFMTFHNQKLLGPQYTPRPFCFAIRRPNHYPDGILSIEKDNGEAKMEPIQTLVHVIPSDNTSLPIVIPISSATTVQMTGTKFLHGWIQNRFASYPRRKFRLAARARQFSGFMLLIGNLASSNKFIPKDAIILQNRDELFVPLFVSDLPTAKEFNDAISSLSPEQQRFARSFRGMQLASSVVGVCVIQLKPQMETLLGLPPDALTKEIRLTQDLMALFIDYQIPSDLLSFDGPEDAPLMEKVDRVKTHTKAVLGVIEETKLKEMENEVKKANMAAVGLASASYAADIDKGVVAPASESESESECESVESGPLLIPKEGFGFAARSLVQAPPILIEEASGVLTDRDGIASTSQEEVVGLSEGLQDVTGLDFTALPKKLDAVFREHDDDNALRTTIIKTSGPWEMKMQENLLSALKERTLWNEDQKSEKEKAFDLLDALSRSGALPVESAELHVILAVTHCFEDTVMETVVKRNQNPIEKLEKSTLLVASTIHNTDIPTLVQGSPHTGRLLAQHQQPPDLLS